MTNNSIFTRVLSLVLCVIMFAGVLTSCLQMPEFKPTLGTHNHTTPNAGTTTGDHVDNEPTDDPIVPDEPVDPNELYSGLTTLANSDLIYGTLANDVFIGGEEGVAAMIPADVKVEAGASSLALSIKKVEDETLADTLSNLDVHISGIALDNTVPMTVMLGAILPAGLGLTELKLYHVENGTPVLMTRVNSTTDFAIHNQYVYDAETGNVTIYVSSFSVFTAVQTTADVWDGTSDYTWYDANNKEFTLTSAEQLAGFRDLVDAGNTFEGKTVKLGVDIDLANIPFDPIGFGYWYEKNVVEGKDQNTVFMGTFDGGNHTIYNLYENCWELDPDKTNYGTYTYSTAGAGLFASIKNATIQNLAISGAEIVFECVDMGVLVGYAQGECHFENIVITNANIANYNRYTGGLVGEVSYGVDNNEDGYTHTFKNITIDSTVTVSGLWGSFGCGMGGVIGGKWGDAIVLMENVVSAPVMDVYNDVVSAYQWYAFRGCGMLIGHTEEPYSDGRHSGIATANFLTCQNVKVYYGEWVNYTYYEFENQDNATGRNYPWVRAEAGEYCDAFSNIRYGVPTHNGVKVSDLNEEELKAVATDYTPIIFNQLYGADRGMYGQEAHEGVTVINKNTKTIYIQNNLGWENLKLHYWYKHDDDTWTNHDADGIDMSKMLVEYGIYKVSLPAYAYGFIIVASEGASEKFILSELTEDTRYTLGAEKAPGVSIGGTTYPTLQEALNKVKDGETITLNTDVTLTTPLTVSGGVSITLDLAGKTITANYEGKVIDNKSIVEVLLVNGANVTIKNGTMIANGDGEYVQVISAINGATVTIENGTFTSTGCTAIYATTGATVTINGGHFNAETPYEEDGRYYTLDVNEAEPNRGTIVVNGGTFENFNPANHTTDGKDYTNKLADGLHATQNGTTYTVEAHTAGATVVEKETASSCTATGSYDNVVYCTGCNAELSRETVTVDAKGHTPSTEADCENAQTCTVCGVVITPALGHTPGTEATCTTAQTCTVCGTTLVGAIGHNYETVVTKPTCTEGGYTTYTCSCGDTYIDNHEEATGHTFVDNVCTVCHHGTKTNKYIFSDYPKGTQYAKDEEHTLDDFITILSNGGHFTDELRLYSSNENNSYAIIKSDNPIKVITLNAGYKADTLIIYGSNDDGTTWTNVAEIEIKSTYADYTAELTTAYKWLKLDVEGSNQIRIKYIKLTTIPDCTDAITKETIVATTCTENGRIDTVCESCGEVISTVMGDPATGHQNTTTTTVNATCTEAGSTTVTCNDCNTVISTETIPTIDHTDVNTDNDHNCDVCGTENVTEHNYVDGICSVCGANEGGSTDTENGTWEKKELAEITSTDIVVIVWTKGDSSWALTSANGSSSAPAAVAVTVNGNQLTSEIVDALKWNISNDNGNLTIYPNGTTATWLYCTSNNNGVRVGTNANKVFTIDSTSGYLKNTATSRYLGVYNAQDVRCYTSTTTNIENQTIAFYVLSSETPACTHENTTTTSTATCTQAGIETVTCDDCKEVISTDTIEANGHNYVDGICSVCGEEDPDYNAGGESGFTQITASKTIAELITQYGWTSSTTKQSFKLDDNVTVKINGGTNTGKAYDSNHIRIYATDSPAGTMTISLAEGYELVSIKITTQTGTYAFLYVDGTTTDICNKTVEVSGNSVLLNSVKNGSDGKQVRVTAIEVVYQATN